jgi:hypothetical protein
MLLKVLLLLYKVFKAETHWFHTYHSYYTNKLKLQQLLYNTYLLFTTINSNANHITNTAIVGLQTDDTLIICNTVFKKKESEELKNTGFLAKPT